MFKVEKGVALPDRVEQSKYPFAEMEVGDSFLTGASDLQVDRDSVGSRAFAASWRYGRKHNMKFASRREGEFFRIWRIA